MNPHQESANRLEKKYLSAKEVTAQLGISLSTLYSYVSRGLIRSEETDGTTRHKRYLAADVDALRNRRDRRRNPAVSAAGALDFGDPVLESSITLIADGKLYYRGRSAVELARAHRAEDVAGLLWRNAERAELTIRPTLPPGLQTLLPTLDGTLPDSLTPVERFHVLLPIAEAHDLAAHDKSVGGVCKTAGRIYGLFRHAIESQPVPTSQANKQATQDSEPATREWPTLAAYLACWGRTAKHPPPQLIQLLDAALILSADHELNASSFTARCVASTGATPYGAVAAALAALQGPRHGGDTARCELLIREASANPRQALTAWLRRGEPLPGFGHRLYPDGDPRARFLLTQLRKWVDTVDDGGAKNHNGVSDPHANTGGTAGRSILDTVDNLILEVGQNLGRHPNIDMGLAAISLALEMPPGAGLTLFSAGRILGWIAHIIEQYQSDSLIRPRARYTGPTP